MNRLTGESAGRAKRLQRYRPSARRLPHLRRPTRPADDGLGRQMREGGQTIPALRKPEAKPTSNAAVDSRHDFGQSVPADRVEESDSPVGAAPGKGVANETQGARRSGTATRPSRSANGSGSI